MNAVPSIVYAHPIKELPPIQDSVSSFALERSGALESASLVHSSSGGNPHYERANFVASKDSDAELIALATNGNNGSRFQIPTYKKPAKPLPPKNTPEKRAKDIDDYLFQFYIGSVSIVGLLILYRLIRKNE
jgi:hypothetical protein